MTTAARHHRNRIVRNGVYALAAVATVACAKGEPVPSLGTFEQDLQTPAASSPESSTWFETPPVAKPVANKIFAHSPDTLFVYEPDTKNLTEIGKFSCLANIDDSDDNRMIDIAVDRARVVYGATFRRLVVINPRDATCQEIVRVGNAAGGGAFPNSLAFASAGTLSSDRDVLVGYVKDQFYRIETEGDNLGKMTPVGPLNKTAACLGDDNAKYEAAGDLIASSDNAAVGYLTVQKQPRLEESQTRSDWLAKIDMKTGACLQIIGAIGQPNLYGLAYAAGKLVGFSANGNVVSIEEKPAADCKPLGTVVKTLSSAFGPTGAAPKPVPWYGAG